MSSSASYQAASPGQIQAYALAQNSEQSGSSGYYRDIVSPQAYSSSSQAYFYNPSSVVQGYTSQLSSHNQAQPQVYSGLKSLPSSSSSSLTTKLQSTRSNNRYTQSIPTKYSQPQQLAYTQQGPVAYAQPNPVAYTSAPVGYAQVPQVSYAQVSAQPQTYQQGVQAPSVVYSQSPVSQVAYKYVPASPTTYTQSVSSQYPQSSPLIYTPSVPYATQADYGNGQQFAYTQESQVAYAQPQQITYSQVPQAVAYVPASALTKTADGESASQDSTPQYTYNYDFQVDTKSQGDRAADASQVTYAIVDPSDTAAFSEYTAGLTSSEYRQGAGSSPKGYVGSPQQSYHGKNAHSSPRGAYPGSGSPPRKSAYSSSKPMYSPQVAKYTASLAHHYY